MKTKTWILIFSLLAAVCIAFILLFSCGGEKKNTALVYSDGVLVMRIDLSKNDEYHISHGNEWNLLSVKDGKICVYDASCQTHDCVNAGSKNHGAPIVCLPNRLVIEFEDTQLDAVLR